MIIDQYRPQAPDADNALHQLQLMRIEAGREAREGWRKVRLCAEEIIHPRPATRRKPKTLVGTLLANAQTIATGAMIGLKVVKAVRNLTRRK